MRGIRVPLVAFTAALFVTAILVGCQGEPKTEGSALLAQTEGCKGPDGGLVLLGNFLGGEFQLAGEDGPAGTLRMVPIWPQTTDSYWFYEEIEAGEGGPPLQFVHHLTGKDGAYRSTVHRLLEPERYLHARAEDFDALTPEQLVAVEGCVIPLHREAEFLYSGRVPVGACAIGPIPAEGATLEMKVTPQTILFEEVLTDGERVESVFQKSGV